VVFTPASSPPGAADGHLARRGGPNAVAVVGHIHRLRLSNLPRLRIIFNSAFGVFLGSWFFFFVGDLVLLVSLSSADVEELWSRSRDVLDVDVNRYPW
jgi:hypothetical protein